jgi:DNA polymerase-1
MEKYKVTNLHELFLEMKEEQVNAPTQIDDRVLIIDALNTYIRCFVAVPTMNDEGEHVGGITGFLKSIGSAIRIFKPSRCIVVFDGKGGSQRRRKLFPEYKENRRHMARLNRTYDFRDKDEERQAMKWQLILLARLLQHLPVTVLAPPNVEADDVIAYLAHLSVERDGEAIIVSTDKDFLQIVSDKIEIWNPIKKKRYNVKMVMDEFGIHPNNFIFYRALDGDKSDNIPGVKGVGRKMLIRSFPQLAEGRRMDVKEILEYASEQKKGKMFENIVANKELIERNLELMRLDIVQMSGQTKLEVLKEVDNNKLNLNRNELTTLLAEHKMLDVFGDYNRWILTTFQPLMRFTSNDTD